MPTGAERLVWGAGDGSTMPVFDTDVGRLGAVICWENYMPLLRMSMYAKGIQVWCAPTADSRDTWTASMRHIACEGRCFVLSANQFARRSDYPDDYPLAGDHEPDDVLCRGASMIVSPLGEILAGPAIDGERDPSRRHRPRPDHRGEVRLRRRRPLRPTRRVPPPRQRSSHPTRPHHNVAATIHRHRSAERRPHRTGGVARSTAKTRRHPSRDRRALRQSRRPGCAGSVSI